MKLVHLIFFIFISTELFSKNLFNSKTFTLTNGLKVIVVENKRAPVVAQMIWYDFGSGVEEKGKSGLAHFMEHLMFKGTKKFPNDYYSNFLSKIGGSENAFTSYDYTAYYQIFPSSETERIIEMEADRMRNLTLTKANIETEKKVILEERFQRIESKPSSQLDESMRTILFPNHYYGRPIIGWKHEIETLVYQDVLDFYNKYYNPNNATLVLSGDIDLETAKKLTKRFFGKIRKAKNLPQKKLLDPDLRTSVFVELDHPNVKQSIWKKMHRVDSYNQSIENGIALDIGLKILVGGSTSMLYEELVNKKKIFSMIGGFYQGLTKGDGYAFFYAIPIEYLDSRKIDKIVSDAMRIAIKKKITLEKVNLEKKKYFFDSVYGMDGILKPAEIIGEAVTVGIKLEDIENWNEKLEQIDLEDVIKALNEFYENKNFVIGSLKN